MNENHILPFLWMRGEDEQIIRLELAKIYKSGIRSVCLEARPHPDYAGEKYRPAHAIALGTGTGENAAGELRCT